MPDHRDEDPRSTAEKLIAQHAELEGDKTKIIENMDAYLAALNGMAASPNGALVLRTWIRAFGIFAATPSRDGIALVREKAYKDFYMTFVRPFLDLKNRQELER